MSDNRKPKLNDEITSSTARNPVEYRMTLKFDDPLEKQGDWGPYFLYTVVHDGTEKVLFATPAKHKQIEQTGAKAGDEISIVQMGEGKSQIWDVQLESQGDSEAPQDKPLGPTTPVHTQAPSGGRVASTRASFAEERNRYLAALELAKSDMEELDLPFTVDLNAVAFTYKKMADDTGHELNPDADQVSKQETPSGDGGDSKVDQLRTTLEKAFRSSGLDQGRWMELLTAIQGSPVLTWDEVSMDTGKAAFSWAKQVNDGELTWQQIFEAIGPSAPEDTDFPEDAPWA